VQKPTQALKSVKYPANKMLYGVKTTLLMVTYGDFPAQNLQVLFARLYTFHFQTFAGHVTAPLNV
jgi:hypothetical protein